MRSTLLLTTALLGAGLLLNTLPVQAQLGLGGGLRMPPPPGAFSSGPAERQMMSPSDAARIAQQQNGGGKVLSVDRGDRGYRVKLLKKGDVRIVYVPGN